MKYNKDIDEDFAKMFKALGHYRRVAILNEILKFGCGYPSKLAEKFNMTKEVLSWHLKELKNSGLIIFTQESRFVKIEINKKKIIKIKSFFDKF